MKRTMMRTTAVSTLALAAAFAAADTVKVTVNGNQVSFDAAQPVTMNGRVLVPLRGVFEEMGSNVDWDPATQTVMANGNGRRVRLKIGSYDANVNGHVVTMDVAPRILEGSTMVPLRFLSQSLGASVDWQPENDLVAITTHEGEGGRAERFAQPPTPPPTPPAPIIVPPPTVIIQPPAEPRPEPRHETPPPPPPPYIISRDTVIPLRLDQQLASNGNRPGDHFTATVTAGSGRYMDLPEGTVVQGYVREATAASGSHAGTLDLRFTHILFPDGNSYRVRGIVTRLDDKSIVRTDDGRFVARNGVDNNVARDAEIGAGAGLVLGSLKGKAVGGAVLGGVLGAVVGAFDHRMARNVIFNQGTQFGLILDHEISIDRHDIRDRG